MADFQKKADGKGIEYPGLTLNDKFNAFLNGGVDGSGNPYPKVDMSLWDQATMCGTCHVGGMTYEKDRNGNRLAKKTFMDMGMQNVNPFTSTVWESFTPDTNGKDVSFATFAPWVYPQYNANNPAFGPMMTPNDPANVANRWVQMNGLGQPVAYGALAMEMINPNDPTGPKMPVYAGQLMMPNVKEMDCLFCHLQGYDNVSASAMTQAGSLNAAPAAGAGLMDMTPISPTFMGYNGNNGTVTFQRSGAGTFQYFGKDLVIYKNYTSMEMVSLTPQMVSRIKGKPESENCHQCHATKTLKDLPEMFGTTGTSSGFLSSAPMIYDPPGWGPLGKRMVAFDINAMWMQSGNSPVVTGQNVMSYMMPGLAWPQAMFPTPLSNGTSTPGYLGGGNAAKTGPLYYYNDDTNPNQDVLKRSTAVFARAEWFKRGDAWQAGQDVHSFGCGGCHFTGDSVNKNQCDPGRGFDHASTIQDGVPPISKGQVVKGYNPDGTPIIATTGAEIAAAVKSHDTRNTVKRCEFCHVTGKDYYGNPIETFGAPNPTAAHQTNGLLSSIVQISDKLDFHNDPVNGGYGGQGVSEHTNFDTPNTKLGRGNHLDVMDCTVCHVQKVSMAVRALDATSGMRYPAVVGTVPSQGMIGLFEDPAPAAFNEGARQQYNGMFTKINTFFGYSSAGNFKGQNGGPGYQPMIPAGTHVVGSPLQEWKPLHLWQKLGNMEAPLTHETIIGSGNGDNSNMKFRRKIYLSNAISAVLWNNTDPAVDANGDTVPGGLLIGDNDSHHRAAKPSLVGYKEIFDGGAPNHNNTQGYGEPIYDPWIMRDLKAGFNFGPSALSVISIGFGKLGGAQASYPYQSAYMPDGTFTGAWRYVSVWSGATVFTEPEQIAAYKAWRNELELDKPLAQRKNWNKTELAYVGAPFMVTHGVKNVQTYVKGSTQKGQGCADCHAANKGFFNGGFDMVGTAIPADRTFNPTSYVEFNPANGNLTRVAGVPTLNTEIADNLMSRPLEKIRVKALKGDLRTVLEGFNKLGQPRSTTFEGTDGTYVWTKDLDRADALYPAEDGAIYYAISDVEADGTPKAGAVKLTGKEYADYMEGKTVKGRALDVTAVAAAAGAAPVATISTIGIQAATGGTSVVKMVKGEAMTASAAAVGTGMTYKWEANKGATITSPTAGSTSISFDKPGIWRLVLTVTNQDGKVSKTVQRVSVADPVLISFPAPVVSTINAMPTTAGSTTAVTTPITVAAGTDYTYARVLWGDGSTSSIINNPVTSLSHNYVLQEKYKAVVNGDWVYTYRCSVQLIKQTTVAGVVKKTVVSTITVPVTITIDNPPATP